VAAESSDKSNQSNQLQEISGELRTLHSEVVKRFRTFSAPR